jgi:preprotein translocase subunit SecA
MSFKLEYAMITGTHMASISSFFGSLFGGKKTPTAPVHSASAKRTMAQYQKQIDAINALEPTYTAMTDAALAATTTTFKARLAKGETLDAILPEAFAAVREASRRTLGQRHFDVQLAGGIILHSGAIAEMRTGEGKTLVATLPVYLNALTGNGVHVITVNDYLSRRDAAWMGQIYDFLGLSVAVINHDASYVYDRAHRHQGDDAALDKTRDEMGSFKVVHEYLRPASRREAYAADITYGTNSEFGFDYLRDNLEYNPANVRQRAFAYAVVDEIDSNLIDEARTPLIISSPTTDSEGLYVQFAGIVQGFQKDIDYTVDEKQRAVQLTDAGIQKAEAALGIGNIYTDKGVKYVHHLETAVRAKALFQRDTEYVVREGEVIIVDTFTGRLQPGRRWSEGLHQAIEAKEGVSIQKESRTFASITYQNYFRLYKKLAGMTGTAETSKEEFLKVYGLDTVVVPTHRVNARHDANDLIFQTEKGKFKAIARKVKELHSTGQPVLIGTVSIEKNEMLSAYLRSEGVPHEVLNAKNHEREGEIVAQAGRLGAVTIATNMAGRGVDIKLGGNPAPEGAAETVKQRGGLFVLGTERHEARRIDNQLRGRAGRQGDPGATQFFVSLEDSLMRVFASDTVKKMMGRLGVAEDEAIENRIITRALESAQTKIEGFHFDARKNVLEYDNVLNHQRMTVYERRRALLMGDAQVVAGKLAEIIGGDATLENAIKSKIAEFGEEPVYKVVRQMLLQTIDMFWVDHLELMEHSRASVNLRAYGQRDPLVEYKREGLRLFKEMEAAVQAQVRSLLPHIGATVARPETIKLQEVRNDAEAITENTSSIPKSSEPGRNDPCPCGSGKKYKKCGALNTEEHERLMAGKK